MEWTEWNTRLMERTIKQVEGIMSSGQALCSIPKTPTEVNLTGRQVPPTSSLNVFESMQRSQVDKVLTRMAQ